MTHRLAQLSALVLTALLSVNTAAEPDAPALGTDAPGSGTTASGKAAPATKTASLGMGLSFIADWSSQIPFLDFMKQARAWKDWRSEDAEHQVFITDRHGWITELKPGQTAGTVFWVAPQDLHEDYQNFVVLYEGEGTIAYRWSTRKDVPNSTPGRDVIQVKPGANLLEITATNPKNPVRAIRIVPRQYEQALLNGEVFNPQWQALVEPFNTLRFLDWTKINQTTQKTWAERPQLADRTWSIQGVPWELAFKLSRDLNVKPWINIPHMVDDNYVRQLAQLAYDQLPSHLPVYLEFSNEVWNGQFSQWRHAREASKALWGNENLHMEWLGLRTAEVCEQFREGAFKAEPQRVRCVLGAHTAYYGRELESLRCPTAVKNRQSTKACHLRGLDYVAITTYFYGGLVGPSRRTDNPAHAKIVQQWASMGAAGLDLAFEQLMTGKPMRPIQDYPGIEQDILKHMTHWSKVAKDFKIGLVAYEGGQHISANAMRLQDDQEVAAFHIAINRDPRMQQVYDVVLKTWQNHGGGLHVFYMDVGRPSKWGSWGHREVIWGPDTPRWSTVMNFNNNIACWWSDCGVAIPTSVTKTAAQPPEAPQTPSAAP